MFDQNSLRKWIIDFAVSCIVAFSSTLLKFSSSIWNWATSRNSYPWELSSFKLGYNLSESWFAKSLKLLTCSMSPSLYVGCGYVLFWDATKTGSSYWTWPPSASINASTMWPFSLSSCSIFSLSIIFDMNKHIGWHYLLFRFILLNSTFLILSCLAIIRVGVMTSHVVICAENMYVFIVQFTPQKKFFLSTNTTCLKVRVRCISTNIQTKWPDVISNIGLKELTFMQIGVATLLVMAKRTWDL